ncbi:MAG TPA: DUF2339 domain-containing protein [Ornithinibacter sp.]|nr:DUF2339 domain-containing protein [Ornithinibacter sp.]
MSNRAAVHQLESDFADAMNRLYAVGNGLARLRSEMDREAAAAMPPAQPAPSTSRPAAAVVRPTSPAAPAVPPPPRGVAAPPAAPVPWYRREGAVTRVLAVAGAVITMAGVAMLLVLAAQQGWFGPPARVAAGAVLAAVLVWLGVRGGEADRRGGASVGSAPVALVATGAAAAYLDVVAVTSGYGWVVPGVGLVLAGLVALGGLHLARRWDSEMLAVLLIVGAAGLAPVVAGGDGWVVSAFLGVLCVAGWWAGGLRTRPALTVVRVLPVTLSLLVAAVDAPRGAQAAGHLAVAVVVLAATLVTSAISVRRDAHDVSASVAVALLTTGLLVTTVALDEPVRTLALGSAAAVLLLAATSLARRPLGPVADHFVATVGAGGAVLAVLAVVSGAPDRFVTTGLLLLALGGLAAAGVGRSRISLALAAGVALVAVLAWVQHPLAALTASTAGTHDMVLALVDSVLVGAVVATGLWAVGNQRGLGREVRLAATVVAWVLGLGASTTVLVAVGTLLGARVGETTLGFTVGHAVATVTWMLAAAWLLLRGLERSRDADLTLRTGLVLAGISVAKLFLFDLAALSGLVRSVAFIVMGLLLLATGSRYAKAYERSRLAG